MAVIVRNDRGKVIARINRIGRYVDLSGIKRMTPVEAYKVATELAAFVGADSPNTARMVATEEEASPSGPACEVCGKRFKDGRGMAGHSRTHAGQELGVA